MTVTEAGTCRIPGPRDAHCALDKGHAGDVHSDPVADFRWRVPWLGDPHDCPDPTCGAAPEPGGLPMTVEEAAAVETMTTAVYAGDPYRNPEQDVRWLLALLGRLDGRLTPDCPCPCHADDAEHCDHCCQGPMCDDCRAYARQG